MQFSLYPELCTILAGNYRRVCCITIRDKNKQLILLILLQDLGMRHEEDHT
jgi:hypothetical protein